MPIFEYRCRTCEHEFEELVFGDAKPECPECGAAKPVKLMSAHSVGKGSSAAPARPAACGGCPNASGPGACGLN